MLRAGLGCSREHQPQASQPQGQQPSRSSRTQPGLDSHDGPRSTMAASMFKVGRENFSPSQETNPGGSVACSATGEQVGARPETAF